MNHTSECLLNTHSVLSFTFKKNTCGILILDEIVKIFQ